MPGGYVTEEGIDYLVRVGDKTANIEELVAIRTAPKSTLLITESITISI